MEYLWNLYGKPMKYIANNTLAPRLQPACKEPAAPQP